MKTRLKKICFSFAVAALLLVSGCSARAKGESEANTKSVHWQDYDGKRIGVITGTPLERIAPEKFPKSKIYYYNSYPDMNVALLAGVIDAYLGDEPGVQAVHAEEPKIDYIPEYLAYNDYAFAFRKNDEKRENLRKELNAFLAKIKADGTFKKIQDIWLGDDESLKVVDLDSLTGENGTLSVATTSTDMPWSYIKDGKNAGYDIDIVARFCKERGYKVDFVDVDFAARIPMVQSGKCDFSTDMNATPERREAVNFSDPTAQGGIVLAVPASALTGAGVAKSAAPSALDILSKKGARIGVESGTTHETMVKKLYPSAELCYYEKMSGYTAVAQGKLDAYVYDKRQMTLAVQNGLAGVRVLDESIGEPTRIALGLSRLSAIPELEQKVNQFIAEMKVNGTLDDMFDRWVNKANFTMPELPKASAPLYHLTVGTTGDVEPYSFYQSGQLTGYDIELMKRFGLWLNADVDFQIFDWGSIVAAAQSGKADIIASDLQISPERAEALTFSDVLFSEENGVMVRDSGATNVSSPKKAEYQTFAELNGKTVSMLTGAPFENLISSKVPHVKEYTYFLTAPDMMLAIKTGKTDAGFMNNAVAELVANRDAELAVFPESLGVTSFGLGFAKGGKLHDEWQAAYDKIPQEAKDALWKKWTGADDSVKTLPEQNWPGKNGTVRVAACDALEPMSYMGKDTQLLGLDIETILLIAKECDVRVEFIPMDFSAVLASLASGKADIICGSIVVTKERAEAMDFIEYQPAKYVLIVRSVAGSVNSDIGEAVYKSLAELAGKRIGVQQGTLFDALTAERIPDARISYFRSVTDECNALKTGKIDAFVDEEPSHRVMMREDKTITALSEYLEKTEFGMAFPKTEKGRALNKQVSEYIARIKNDGTLKEIEDLWFDGDESEKTLEDYTALPATNGTLTLGTEGLYPPFNFVKNGQVVGYEIDIVARFCREYGYGLKVEMMDFDAILPSVQMGKCDFAIAGMSITDERKESVDFSEGYYTSRTLLVVLKKAVVKDSFLDSVKSSFEKTFVREDRYKLFLSGIGTTLLITVLSILFGTILGFVVFMTCRNGNRAANLITKFFTWLISGLPVVVLLMILYYIIFAKSQITGAAVSVIAFTLVFGSGVFAMLKSGVGAIDKGQTEAALSLGYGDIHSFFRIILPQAIPHFLPAYKGEIVSLIKATAVVGYIAVQDLTKMGDIVRGRTYEAFFPLIAVAVIYFVLAALLTFIVNRLEILVNPKRRKREDILKGVV